MQHCSAVNSAFSSRPLRVNSLVDGRVMGRARVCVCVQNIYLLLVLLNKNRKHKSMCERIMMTIYWCEVRSARARSAKQNVFAIVHVRVSFVNVPGAHEV